MDHDDQTIAVYDQQADNYSAFTATTETEPALVSFMAKLPTNGVVLDLGCGPGNHAAAMSASGFRVTAVDASSSMVALARKHPGIQVLQATFDELAEKNLYDGIWANFSLLHSPKKAFPDHLARAANALKPGGILHLGMKTGIGEDRDKLGRHYAYYTIEELRKLVSDTGLEIEEETFAEALGLAGGMEPSTTIIARRH